MRSLKSLYFFLTTLILMTIFSHNSFAMNYCAPKGKKTSVTLIVPQNFNLDAKKELLKTTHDFLKKVIIPGDFVNFSIAKKNMINTVVNECFPGCPPTGFLGQVLGLGTDCNQTRMQRDKKIFDRKLFSPLPKLFKADDIIKDGVSDLFSSLENIAKFNKTNTYDNTYIISLMNPFPNKNINENKIDTLFLDLVQNDRLPKALPNATYIGVTQNSKLILFWNDVFKALKMKFNFE